MSQLPPDIAQRKRDHVRRARETRPLADVMAVALGADDPRNLRSALQGPVLRLIAEIRRPPRSGGTADALFDPRIIAQEFAGAGAAALSVWTDNPDLGAEPHLIHRARSYMALPVVCWDFIIDEYQVCEARANEADAVALTAALLSDDELQGLMEVARDLGMAAPVVVTDGWELESAMLSGADTICIENRTAQDGSAELARTERLARDVPADTLLISAHGITSRGDAERAAAAGVDAVLFDPPTDYELARDAIRDLRHITARARGDHDASEPSPDGPNSNA